MKWYRPIPFVKLWNSKFVMIHLALSREHTMLQPPQLLEAATWDCQEVQYPSSITWEPALAVLNEKRFHIFLDNWQMWTLPEFGPNLGMMSAFFCMKIPHGVYLYFPPMKICVSLTTAKTCSLMVRSGPAQSLFISTSLSMATLTSVPYLLFTASFPAKQSAIIASCCKLWSRMCAEWVVVISSRSVSFQTSSWVS